MAWPVVGLLAAAVVLLGVWQALSYGPQHSGASAAPPVRPAELPPDIVRFAGREAELSALLAAVPRHPRTGLGAPVLVGVFGAGGMGKTALATRLAHAVADRYSDGQLFVELRGATPEPTDPSEVQLRLLRTLGLPAEAVPEDATARQALYRSVLANRRVLIYLDDASSETQARPLIPAARGCLVLVTARPTLASLPLNAWRNLDALDEAPAIALLSASVGGGRVEAEPAAAAEVAARCGYLPLALSIAGARLRARPQWTVAELTKRLADEHRRLDELRLGNLDVRASIGLSYADLEPTGARLFRLLSLLEYADFGRSAAAALLGGNDHLREAETGLERLADAKLVEIVGPWRYRLHDLVRLFARERLQAEEPVEEQSAARQRALRYYVRRTRQVWTRAINPDSTTADRAEAEQWLERRRPAIVAAVRHALESGQESVARELAAAVSPYLESHGYGADLRVVGRATEAGHLVTE